MAYFFLSFRNILLYKGQKGAVMSQKEPIRYVKLMISGLVWLFIYLNIMISLCYSLFDFNLISSSHACPDT